MSRYIFSYGQGLGVIDRSNPITVSSFLTGMCRRLLIESVLASFHQSVLDLHLRVHRYIFVISSLILTIHCANQGYNIFHRSFPLLVTWKLECFYGLVGCFSVHRVRIVFFCFFGLRQVPFSSVSQMKPADPVSL